MTAGVEQLDQLREVADQAHLPVDVVAALLIEWKLCADVIAAATDRLLLVAAAAVREARLVPDDNLRAWEHQLAGRGPAPTIDELPEVSLPQRLVARIPKNPSIDALATSTQLAHTIAVERAATRSGMTMETWALRQLLSPAA